MEKEEDDAVESQSKKKTPIQERMRNGDLVRAFPLILLFVYSNSVERAASFPKQWGNKVTPAYARSHTHQLIITTKWKNAAAAAAAANCAKQEMSTV